LTGEGRWELFWNIGVIDRVNFIVKCLLTIRNSFVFTHNLLF
jgi:hypothetical protein